MTVVALVHPSDLLGTEVRKTLSRRKELWHEIRLLTNDDDEAGTLADVGGAATFVQRLEDSDLSTVDCAIFCGDLAATRALLPKLGPAGTAIVLARDAVRTDGRPIVAGVNLAQAQRGEVLLSPHPGAIGLATLLAPLATLAPRQAAATLIEPASLTSGAALDEVIEQTRAILAFQGDWPKDVFGSQMAFNMLPGTHQGEDLGLMVEEILGENAPACTVQRVLAGVFHACTMSVNIRFAADPGIDAIRELLESQPLIEMVDDPGDLGPIRAAARDEVLVGRIRRAHSSEGHSESHYWLWAVFDNLTVGGANNAVSILEAVTATEVH
jgi:aspartate-semialdehyde dehydrogenase